jgi:hypothetical protein
MSKPLILVFLACGLIPDLAAAQAPATRPSDTRNVEVDPIRCWWRTSAGSVRLAEPFDVTLTCAVLETEAVSVVVDESRLGNAVVQMAPFEVVSGSHPADLHSGIRRFFQYEYRLRIINPDVIGKDVPLPDMGLHYRINSRMQGNTAVQGRDLLYYLPQLQLRIASMVPENAGDIRDAQGAPFGGIDDLNFRAGVFNIAGIALMAFGGLMVLLVLVRLARGARRRTPATERELSVAALIGVASRELGEVERERAGAGWTDELADRALSATRVAAAAALGGPISQRAVTTGAEVGGGQLVTRGPRRGMRRIVSAPTTPQDVSRRLARGSSDAPGQALEELRDALVAFGNAQYGREGKKDESLLDDALGNAKRAAATIRSQYAFPRSIIRRWTSPGTTAAESRA